MNDKNENSSAEEKSDLIGVDPLAWLSEEEKASMLNENKSTDKSDSVNDEDTNEGASCLIKLNSIITIRDVNELMEELNAISSDKTELVFECEHVEKMDAASLQLLTGFYLFAIEEGKKVVWDKPSDAFCKAVTILGLNDIINIHSVAA
jgi:anti-anti-sigma regulatory factor